MESELLKKLKIESDASNETIKRLQIKIEKLKSLNDEDETIRNLKEENKKLKEQVEELKKELISLDGPVAASFAPVKLEQPPPPAAAAAVESKPVAEPKQQGKGNNKEAKEKKPKAEPKVAAPAEPVVIDYSKCDVRVGKIVECSRHPEADGLYLEQIDVGEGKTRTVVSGLVKYVPIEEMQNRLILVLCNLKPAKLRGILSEAMVLCASTPEKVELLLVPEGAAIGDRVTVAGYEGAPEKEINSKNNIFAIVQPDLKTNDNLEATYKGVPLEIKSKGVITTKSLKNVPIK